MPKQQQQSKKQQQQSKSEEIVEEESSSSEQEDSDAELINDSIAANFLSALSRIKQHDNTLYSLPKPLFNEQDFNNTKQEVHKLNEKKLTYKDLQRQNILNEKDNESMDEQQVNVETPAQQKKRLKQSFKKAFQTQEEEDQQIFKVKKQQKPKKMQEEQYNQTLQKLARNKEEEELYKRMWGTQKDLDQQQDFLRKYILQKGWVDKSDNKYKLGKTAERIDQDDDKMSEQVEEFQQKYNFRYQQPGSQVIQTFPRSLDETLRQKTKETRSEKRKRKQEEKKKAFQQQLKEIQKLKEQKKHQIVERIQKLQADSKVQNIEIEEDNEEDQQPNNQWFYCDDCERGLKEGQAYFECETCDSYTLCTQCFELIIHQHKLKQKMVESGCGCPNEQEVKRIISELLRCKKCKVVFNQFDNHFQFYDEKSKLKYLYCSQCQDILPLTLKKRCHPVKQTKVKLNQALQNNPYVLKELTLDDEVDRLIQEYNALDVVQGPDGKPIKCKFNYIQVKPQSFGLSDEQLLYSDDKQLQKYVSITKLRPYLDKNLKVRNSIYKQKISGIQKSATVNKQQIQQQNALIRLRNKKRLDSFRKRIQKRNAILKRKKERVNLVDLSQKDSEIKHFISSDRLASYTS